MRPTFNPRIVEKYPARGPKRKSDQHGERNHRAKLTPEQVDWILNLHAEGLGARRIWRLLRKRDVGVSESAVAAVCEGKTWLHRE